MASAPPSALTWRCLDAAAREREYSPSSAIGGDYQPFIQAYADLDTLHKNLTGLGVTPQPLPDKISVEHLSETISTRIAKLGKG